ncbi:GFA family protein [Bacteriovoracaceae bacterium]|nr:GFA family protein [Bacteriovoracaceae bacterium]
MINGSCLCGEVKFKIRLPFIGINNCYCSRCRKASGSAFGTFLHTTTDLFELISGEESINNYKPKDGDKRPFCLKCGCRVPSVIKEENHVIVPAGCLDDDMDSYPLASIYTDSKTSWSNLDESIPCFPQGAPEGFWQSAIDNFEKQIN